MSGRIHFDNTDVEKLALVLAAAADVAPMDAKAIVAKGALNIKTDAQKRVAGLKHAPSYPAAISYDTTVTPDVIWADIGPDKNKRQGALGNLLEFGSVNNAPKPHMLPAALREMPKFEQALQKAAEKRLEGR